VKVEPCLFLTVLIFTRAYYYSGHRPNPHYRAMILALCAFTFIQPIQAKERDLVAGQVSEANMLIAEAVKMRMAADFGQDPSLETVLTSVFLFAFQYGRAQHNAAWFRLQEAVAPEKMLRLHGPRSYDVITDLEGGMRLRTYWLLCITERYCIFVYTDSCLLTNMQPLERMP